MFKSNSGLNRRSPLEVDQFIFLPARPLVQPNEANQKRSSQDLSQKNSVRPRTGSFPQPVSQIRQNRQPGSNSLRITRQSGNSAFNWRAPRRATGAFGNIPK